MKTTIKRLLTVLCAILLVVSSATTAFAHSGRTDSRGGHKDNKNRSGLGSYHYHCGGYPAHLHSSGYCPYRDVFPSSVKIKAEKTTLGIGEKVSIEGSVYPSNSCNTSISWSCSDTSVISLSNGIITAKAYGTAVITAESFNGKKNTIKITVKEITANKVTVSGLPESEAFYIGDTFTLASQITPDNVDNPTIVWSSSDDTIATVSESGKVKLLDKGKVEIRATASNGVTGKVSINVKEKYVDTVEISESEIDMLLGANLNIVATVSPADATYPELSWKVEDPTIISVSEDGEITALACGESVVTATSTNGISDSVLVRVSEIKAESIEIDGPTSVLLGDSISLSCQFDPVDTTDQNIQWSVDDHSIAKISDDGRLVANNLGTVTVTAMQKDVSTTCTIEVLPIDVEDIIISVSADDTISKGDTVEFFAEVFPENATYPEITWSVSDPKIASINTNGVLTALKGGEVTVVATSADGYSAEYKVRVSSPVAGAVGAVGIVGVGAAVISAVKKKKKK